MATESLGAKLRLKELLHDMGHTHKSQFNLPGRTGLLRLGNQQPPKTSTDTP